MSIDTNGALSYSILKFSFYFPIRNVTGGRDSRPEQSHHCSAFVANVLEVKPDLHKDVSGANGLHLARGASSSWKVEHGPKQLTTQSTTETTRRFLSLRIRWKRSCNSDHSTPEVMPQLASQPRWERTEARTLCGIELQSHQALAGSRLRLGLGK